MESDVFKLFWIHDPNGLVIVRGDLKILEANPAFERMFQIPTGKSKGFDISKVLGESGLKILRKAFESEKPVIRDKVEFSPYGLVVRLITFKVPQEEMVAAIFVDITEESLRQKELSKIKIETLDRVRRVILKQMEIAQEIASLLGETTAETKVSLLKLLESIQEGGEELGLHNSDQS